MKNFLLLAITFVLSCQQLLAQFPHQVDADFLTDKVVVPQSPLKYQILFIGGVDQVEATATYGNPAGTYTAKEWNDFIGFTPDVTGSSLGWVSVNHERVIADDNLGDGGGMTVFRIERDPNTDTLVVIPQTLDDGRSGMFFNVDFANTTGETGMNCGGITSSADGRIWTAEEWFRGSNEDIADRDTSNFVIGTGTMNGQASPAGFPGYNGQTIEKYQNYNYMTEIDPRQAVAIRKQYNWGRQPFEGGVVLPDNKTVLTGADATPGFFTKFVADNAGDFTTGTTYVYKHDAPTKWIEIDNSDLNKMLNFASEAVAVGATMFNRLEWVAYDALGDKVYICETGRDNPGSRWDDEAAEGGVHAPHHIARATAQGVSSPNDSDYWDYYGRVLVFDPSTDDIAVHLEAGPYFENSPSLSAYPDNHLSNPDGLNVLTVNGKSFLVINEDLNGTSNGRVPAGISNRTCELYLLDLAIASPEVSDLVRISVAPLGAEMTGACPTPDGKSLLINSQHPSSNNPYPYNHSLTYAVTGWDQVLTSIKQPKFDTAAEFDIFPNPVSKTLYLNKAMDVALYDVNGMRLKVYRNVRSIDVAKLTTGVYFLRNESGLTKKVIIR